MHLVTDEPQPAWRRPHVFRRTLESRDMGPEEGKRNKGRRSRYLEHAGQLVSLGTLQREGSERLVLMLLVFELVLDTGDPCPRPLGSRRYDDIHKPKTLGRPASAADWRTQALLLAPAGARRMVVDFPKQPRFVPHPRQTSPRWQPPWFHYRRVKEHRGAWLIWISVSHEHRRKTRRFPYLCCGREIVY